MANTVPRSPSERIAELDLFRGFAALLMVFNHVGYATLTPAAANHGGSGAVVFLGSFAPVLFFFATGFGAGLAARPAAWGSVADKALLLLLADQFLQWAGGGTWGLDFFSFIAISVLVAALVMATPRPVLVALAGAAAVVVLRYAIGKPLDAAFGDYGVVRWLLGVTAHEEISYPAAPWLVYPLVGAACGVLYRRGGGHIPARAWGAAAMLALLFVAGALVVAARGGSFHRWGTMATAFFALSLAVLIGFAMLSILLAHSQPRLASMLSLGGVASFAVVPVHYAFVRGLTPVHETVWIYLALAGAISVVSFSLSTAFEHASHALGAATHKRWMTAMVLAVIVAAAAATLIWGRSGAVLPAQGAATLGQLGIGLLFAWRVGLMAPKRLSAR